MSLLQDLPYKEYKECFTLSVEQCESICRLAEIQLSFGKCKNPGEYLLKMLDRYGYTVKQYREFKHKISVQKKFTSNFTPKSKVAIIIANYEYLHLPKLITPLSDCDCLSWNLKSLGFIVMTIKNAETQQLKSMLKRIFQSIPENSYCLIFYAGHGCEIAHVKCLLSVDCPPQAITIEHCVTENYILRKLSDCKLNLCIMIMDMCRKHLNRSLNPKIYESILEVRDYTIHNDLLVAYSTLSSQAAYEICQIDCSQSINIDVTYELKTGDLERIVPEASQYVNALCARLKEDLDISSLLDKVHEDVEKSSKPQRPMKIQCGTSKRFLSDPVSIDTDELLKDFQTISEEYAQNLRVC